MVSKQLVDNADLVAEFLSAIGNGKRLAIMCHLLGGELSVGEIAENVELSQSALSQHLAKLRGQGIVDTRKQAQTIFYGIGDSRARQLLALLHDLYCPDLGRDPNRSEDHD